MNYPAGDLAPLTGTSSATMQRFGMTNPITGKKSFARRAIVKNTGASNPLRVYLPYSNTYVTVAKSSEETLEGPFVALSILQDTAATTFEILASVA